MIAACWGLAGAVPYAGTRLATALWGSAEVPPHQQKLALANFLVAAFTGPALAAAAAPQLVNHARGASLESVAFGVGMFCNVIWPLLTDKRLLIPMLSAVFGRVGGWFTGMGQLMKEPKDDH